MIINKDSKMIDVMQYCAKSTLDDWYEISIILTIIEKKAISSVPLQNIVLFLLDNGYTYNSISGKWRK